MDLFSRKIVGWATSATIDGELVLDAVLRAVRRRHPRGTLIHSDHGTQFGSDTWRRFCKSSRLEPSMSRKGNCGDNAVAESFFGSLKSERIKNHIYKTRALATETILEAVEAFYNRARRHTHLGGISPDEFGATFASRWKGVHGILVTPAQRKRADNHVRRADHSASSSHECVYSTPSQHSFRKSTNARTFGSSAPCRGSTA